MILQIITFFTKTKNDMKGSLIWYVLFERESILPQKQVFINRNEFIWTETLLSWWKLFIYPMKFVQSIVIRVIWIIIIVINKMGNVVIVRNWFCGMTTLKIEAFISGSWNFVGGNFYWVVGIWQGVILTSSNIFSQHSINNEHLKSKLAWLVCTKHMKLK